MDSSFPSVNFYLGHGPFSLSSIQTYRLPFQYITNAVGIYERVFCVIFPGRKNLWNLMNGNKNTIASCLLCRGNLYKT